MKEKPLIDMKFSYQKSINCIKVCQKFFEENHL